MMTGSKGDVTNVARDRLLGCWSQHSSSSTVSCEFHLLCRRPMATSQTIFILRSSASDCFRSIAVCRWNPQPSHPSKKK